MPGPMTCERCGAIRPLSYMGPLKLCLPNGVRESLSVSGYREQAT